MSRITTILKIRFAAVIAPIILLVAGAIIALNLYGLGAMPQAIHDNQFAEIQAAREMENALYKMDWGRTQPDGLEIVRDQQRGFVGWVQAARTRATTRDQLAAIEKIAVAANPVFNTMRAAAPGDDSFEPQLRGLQGLVGELISIDDGAMAAIGGRVKARARIMVILTIVACIAIPWICFIAIMQISGRADKAFRALRHEVENISARRTTDPNAEIGKELGAIDAQLTEIGYPKPNPMLAG